MRLTRARHVSLPRESTWRVVMAAARSCSNIGDLLDLDRPVPVPPGSSFASWPRWRAKAPVGLAQAAGHGDLEQPLHGVEILPRHRHRITRSLLTDAGLGWRGVRPPLR